MAEVINLRRARKAKARDAATAAADANRAAFGRTRAERMSSSAETERTIHILDGAKRDR